MFPMVCGLNRPLRHRAFAPKSRGNLLRGGKPFFRAGCVGRLPFMFDMLAGAQQLAAGGVARK